MSLAARQTGVQLAPKVLRATFRPAYRACRSLSALSALTSAAARRTALALAARRTAARQTADGGSADGGRRILLHLFSCPWPERICVEDSHEDTLWWAHAPYQMDANILCANTTHAKQTASSTVTYVLTSLFAISDQLET